MNALRVGAFLLLSLAMASIGAAAERVRPLRVCADPGNMPFSNDRGEGMQNRIAGILAAALDTTVQYYYRPAIERGLTRTTLYADECDLMFDMPADAERVITTTPLYRTTFVLATRTDRGLTFKNLDDPRLKKLKVGVYQTSAIREALADHDVRNNIVIHYLSHDADLVPEDEPAYQLQELVDGKIDVAAVWGPFAGFYKAKKHAAITIEPANLMDDSVPLEYDMAVALRTNDQELRQRLDRALHEKQAQIRAVLMDFGVPLVRCETCLVSGDLPAHGPYAQTRRDLNRSGASAPAVTIATLNDWLAHGADVNTEFNNAVIGEDMTRVSYLLETKHASINALDLQGQTPLIHAINRKSLPMVSYLLAHGANAAMIDRDGWTPLMNAAWVDDDAIVKALIAHGADPNTGGGPSALTPLAIALQYGKDSAVVALAASGADVNSTIGAAGYTPLMLAVVGHSIVAVEELIKRGAKVDARNDGGVTALMIASAGNQPKIVALLLKSGANASAKSDAGDTAMSLARARDYQAVIQVLQTESSAAAAGASHPGS